MPAIHHRPRFRRTLRPPRLIAHPWLESLESRQLLYGSDVLAADVAAEGEDQLVGRFRAHGRESQLGHLRTGRLTP